MFNFEKNDCYKFLSIDNLCRSLNLKYKSIAENEKWIIHYFYVNTIHYSLLTVNAFRYFGINKHNKDQN